VTNEQLVRVVVAEIENEPAFMHLNFVILAGAALKRTWPCKDR
jgi:hypothetical protein